MVTTFTLDVRNSGEDAHIDNRVHGNGGVRACVM